MSTSETTFVPLSDVAAPFPNSFVDGPFGSEMKSDEYTGDGIRLIQLQNIGDGIWFDENKKFISEQKFAALKRHGAVPGDIAIAKMADPVARSCLLPPVANQFIVVADCIKLTTDKSKYDAGFVSRTINSHKTRREAELKSTGTTRLRINLSALKTVHIWAPPLPEQIRITAVLDTVDEAIAKTEAVIAKLKQVRVGLLHDLLTRGLDEHGHFRDPVAHPEQFQDSPLGEIPTNWVCEPLSKHTISSAYGPRFSGEHYSERGNVALLRTTDMDDAGNLSLERMPRADLIIEEFRGHFLEPRDFLISRSGTCGIGAVFLGFRVPVLPGAFLIRFRLASSLLPDFLRLYVNSEIGARRIRGLDEGGVQKNIRGTELLAHLVPVPLVSEQQRILLVVQLFDAATSVEETELAKLQQIKSGLMNDLLTGRVRVPANFDLLESTG